MKELGEVTKEKDTNWVFVRNDRKLEELINEYKRCDFKDQKEVADRIVDRLEEYENIQFPVDFSSFDSIKNGVAFLENY